MCRSNAVLSHSFVVSRPIYREYSRISFSRGVALINLTSSIFQHLRPYGLDVPILGVMVARQLAGPELCRKLTRGVPVRAAALYDNFVSRHFVLRSGLPAQEVFFLPWT